jgi:hypothetical protein
MLGGAFACSGILDFSLHGTRLAQSMRFALYQDKESKSTKL